MRRNCHMNRVDRERSAGARERGVAMLLVMIALSVGTVLAAAALTSRDNSPAIGRNAGALTAANWAADAGAEYGVAVLESTVAWRARNDGVILEDYPMAGARVDANVTNLDGQVPSLTDREVIVHSEARVGDVSATVERRVSLSLPLRVFQPVDPYVSEFAIFATGSMRIESDSRVRTDHRSPEAATLLPISVGMGFSAAADMHVDPDARLRGVRFVVDAGSSGALEQSAEGYLNAIGVERLPLDVPATPAHLPAGFGGLGDVTTKNLDIREGHGHQRWDPVMGSDGTFSDGSTDPQASANGAVGFPVGMLIRAVGAAAFAQAEQANENAGSGANNAGGNGNGNADGNANGNADGNGNGNTGNENSNAGGNGEPGQGAWINSSSTTLPAEGRYERIRVRDAAELIIDEANGRFYEARELILDTDGVLLVRGRVILNLEFDLRLNQGSTIEFADDDSAIAIYVGRHVQISDSGMGVHRIHGRNRSRMSADLMNYTRPQRLRIIGLDEAQGGFRNPSYDIRGNSLVVACIHAPHGTVEVREQSTVIGQVVADDFILRQGSSLLFDPRLDSRSGYTQRRGPLYQANGQTVDSVESVLNGSLTEGAAILSQMINLQLAQEWDGAEDWTIEDADDDVQDVETYYDGFKLYLLSRLATNEDPNALQQAQPNQQSMGAPNAGENQNQLEESDVLNSGADPTRRTPGRVRATSVPRAARALEGGS